MKRLSAICLLFLLVAVPCAAQQPGEAKRDKASTAFLYAAVAADVATTAIGQSRGYREVSPGYRHVGRWTPAVRVGVVVAADVLFLARVEKKHPRLVKVIRYIAGVAAAGAAIHNVQEMRR